jgi:hypothetical protein
MMTFAGKTKNSENASIKSYGARKSAQTREDSPHQSVPSNFLIQRKAGGCACGGGCSGCRLAGSNLAVSQPNDAAEIEADRVAEKVMRMPDNQSQPVNLSRKLGEDGERIFRKEKNNAKFSNNSAASPVVDSVLKSSGQPLSSETKSFFEPRFGHDFSSVRVHTDSDAAVSARTINAKAYTFGKDIVFGHGQFSPDSESGGKLLAHELAHVVQQSDAAAAPRVLHRQEDEATGESAEPAEDNSSAEEPSEAFGEDEAEEMKGGCAGERNMHFNIQNSVDFEFTIPKGCKASLTFSAKWEMNEGGECCTGASTYKVVNGKNTHTLPVAPNICGDREEIKPASGSVTAGGGRQKFNVKVNRQNCAGIIMNLDVKVRISK